MQYPTLASPIFWLIFPAVDGTFTISRHSNFIFFPGKAERFEPWCGRWWDPHMIQPEGDGRTLIELRKDEEHSPFCVNRATTVSKLSLLLVTLPVDVVVVRVSIYFNKI